MWFTLAKSSSSQTSQVDLCAQHVSPLLCVVSWCRYFNVSVSLFVYALLFGRRPPASRVSALIIRSHRLSLLRVHAIVAPHNKVRVRQVTADS